MGLPGFIIGAVILGSSGGGGGGGGGGDTAPVVPTPDDFATWSAANKPDADFNDQFSSYVNYLNEDQFGLTADERGAYIPEHVVSDYTNKIHATEADMKNDDRSFYDQRINEGVTDFDSWLSGQSDDLKNAGYGAQHQAYKNQTTAILNQRPDWMGEDDSSYTTFNDYDPGLFVAGEDYGNFAGSYRTRDEADSAFRNYYAEQIGNFGYGNLITDDMDNAGYVDAYNEAKSRDEFGNLIGGLGYGSLVDPSMTSGQLSTLWDEVQERDRYKGLLDEMGYEYDATDDATSLGYLYNQAEAIEDTKAKLKAAEDAYSTLEGTYTSTVGAMDNLQGEFDELFGSYGSLTTDYGDLQGTYDTLYGQYGDLEKTYGDTKAALGEKAGEYDTLSGLYDTLTSNYGTLTTDYNTAIGDLGTLQTTYGNLSSDYDTLSGEFDALTGTQARTQADLDASLADAQGLRRQKRMGQAVDFLTESAADKQAKIDSGLASLQTQTPALSEYTQAATAMGQTALDPTSYSLQPLEFETAFSPDIFQPSYGGQQNFGLQPMGLNVGQSFNPYFDAINTQYGVDLGLPALGGEK